MLSRWRHVTRQLCRIDWCCRICGGEVAEWPIAPVLKTGEVRASAGSNPALSAVQLSQGLINATPVCSKSLPFRVAKVAW